MVFWKRRGKKSRALAEEILVIRDQHRSIMKVPKNEQVSIFPDGRVVLRFAGLMEIRTIKGVAKNGATMEYVLSEPIKVIKSKEVYDARRKNQEIC